MEDESDVIRSIMDEIHSSDIRGYQMESESDFTGSVIDAIHS